MKSRTLIATALFTGGAALAGLSGSANAVPAIDVIQSPVSAAINAGGPGSGSITNTLNQAGLFTDFIERHDELQHVQSPPTQLHTTTFAVLRVVQ